MDLSSTTGMGLLATGGILAGVAAGWQQVKNLFNYVSSAVIITVHYDDVLSTTLANYIAKEYKLAPSGIHYLRGIGYMNRAKEDIVVPFSVPSTTSIRYRKNQILFLSGGEHNLTIRAIRGNFNPEKFTKDALLFYQTVRQNLHKKHNSSRFEVVKVIGREKGSYTQDPPERKPEKSDGGNSLTSSTNNGGQFVNLQIHQSFMYARDEYIWEAKYDPFASIYFEPEVEKYIEQAQKWYDMKAWYNERDIPWRRGWLLYGPPGTGKSSTGKAVAQKLGLPIYQYYLNTLSDQEFIKKWGEMQRPCIALFEDLDTIFNKRVNLTEHKSLSFDTLLNCISGVTVSDGVFLIVTTNKLNYIDEALGVTPGENGISSRPGRIDTVIHLKGINIENRRKMAQRILKDWPDVIESIVIAGEDSTPVQFMEMCIQYAYQIMEDPLNTKLPVFIHSKPIILNSEDHDDFDGPDDTGFVQLGSRYPEPVSETETGYANLPAVKKANSLTRQFKPNLYN